MLKVLNIGREAQFHEDGSDHPMNQRRDEISQLLVHTGQHYDDSMSGSFFRDLEISAPDIHLDVRSASHAEQTARIMLSFETVVIDQRPDWIVVVGDVNSTLACALVASKLDVRIAHVEAGLRSFDRSMPEEINRILTDQLATLLLTPSPDADANLEREGVSGRHQKHVSAPYNKGCNECHNGFGSGSAEHVNYSIGVAYQTNPGGGSGSYSNMPTNTPGTGYGTCSNVYCHSVVQGPGAAPLPLGAPQYKTPSWRVGVDCGECHALPPSTGAHTLHANDGFVGYAFDCGSCHYQAGYFQGNPTPLHVNKQINIVIDPGHGATATYSKGTGFAPGAGSYGSCSASYCHSDRCMPHSHMAVSPSAAQPPSRTTPRR